MAARKKQKVIGHNHRSYQFAENWTIVGSPAHGISAYVISKGYWLKLRACLTRLQENMLRIIVCSSSLLCETHKDHFACQYKTRKTWIHFTLLCSSKLTNGKEGDTRIRKQLRYSRTHSFVSRTRVMLSKIILPQNNDGLVVINDDQRINLSCLFPWNSYVASQNHLCHMTDKWSFLTNHD